MPRPATSPVVCAGLTDLAVVKRLEKAGAKVGAKTLAVPASVAPGGAPGVQPQVIPAIPSLTPLDLAREAKHAEVTAFLKAAMRE